MPQISRAVLWSPGVPSQNPAYPSKQLLEDPFAGLAGYGETLRLPPFSLEQLTLLKQHSTVHEAALMQKTLDVIGKGPNFLQSTGAQQQAAGGKSRNRKIDTDLQKWWASLGEEYTITEILRQAWHDYETTGWGFLEVARNNAGKVGKLYHIPAHTMRAHMDGHRFAQMRNGRFIWFKRWGDPITQNTDYYAEGGAQADGKLTLDERANEVLVFRSPNSESSWYGIPDYMSGIGWITLASSARDWNIQFFNNMREPRHLIIISGLPDDVTKVSDELDAVMKTAMREPHRNILLPIGGDAKVTIEKLSVENDAQFTKLIDIANAQILTAHRTPPDRLGIVRATGLIGGSTSQIINVANHYYKLSVVNPRQDILADRLENFADVEKNNRKLDQYLTGDINIDFQDTDMTDEAADANIVSLLTKNCVITLNEGRARLGESRLAKFKDMDYMEYLISIGVVETTQATTGMGLPGPVTGGMGKGIPGGPSAGRNTNTKLPGSAAMASGEPQRGRPASPGNTNNPANNVKKSLDIDSIDLAVWTEQVSQMLNDHDDRLEELLHARR